MKTKQTKQIDVIKALNINLVTAQDIIDITERLSIYTNADNETKRYIINGSYRNCVEIKSTDNFIGDACINAMKDKHFTFEYVVNRHDDLIATFRKDSEVRK